MCIHSLFRSLLPAHIPVEDVLAALLHRARWHNWEVPVLRPRVVSAIHGTSGRVTALLAAAAQTAVDLWALLNFLLPEVFDCSGTLDEWLSAPFQVHTLPQTAPRPGAAAATRCSLSARHRNPNSVPRLFCCGAHQCDDGRGSEHVPGLPTAGDALGAVASCACICEICRLASTAPNNLYTTALSNATSIRPSMFFTIVEVYPCMVARKLKCTLQTRQLMDLIRKLSNPGCLMSSGPG